MKYSGHKKLLCELSKLSKLNAFILLGYQTNTDASILVYKFRPERTGFNMYAGRVYATAINFPCIITLGLPECAALLPGFVQCTARAHF